MKPFIFLVCLIFVAWAGWTLGDKISSDSITMLIGLLFGIMAGVPAALIAIASHQRTNKVTYNDNRKTYIFVAGHREDSRTLETDGQQYMMIDGEVTARQLPTTGKK